MTQKRAVRGTGAGRVGEPHKLPAQPASDGMKAMPPALLTFDALRARFSRDLPWQPEVRDDRGQHDKGDTRDAAVLIALSGAADNSPDGSCQVLLTTRPASLPSHSGQIAFPGGAVEAADASRRATALREAFEEVGLNPDDVETIGELPEYITNSGFAVTPVIGLVNGNPELKANPSEVEEIFHVPLPFLMDPDNHQRRRFNYQDQERTFYSMPWVCESDQLAENEQVEYFIWGVTATILRNFFHFLRAQ